MDYINYTTNNAYFNYVRMLFPLSLQASFNGLFCCNTFKINNLSQYFAGDVYSYFTPGCDRLIDLRAYCKYEYVSIVY